MEMFAWRWLGVSVKVKGERRITSKHLLLYLVVILFLVVTLFIDVKCIFLPTYCLLSLSPFLVYFIKNLTTEQET